MSYSVNFSENASGKIVLDNVVMNGAKYAPSAVAEVFTKDAAGSLTKEPIDLTKIQYAPIGEVPTGTSTDEIVTAPVASETPTVETVAVTEAPTVDTGAPTGEPAETALKFTTPKRVDGTNSYNTYVQNQKMDRRKQLAEELKAAVKNRTLKRREVPTEDMREPMQLESGAAETNIDMTDNREATPDSYTVGGSLKKTKRNRRKNKRFVKKSYKRRR
jgi:hypothetical protein